jgi:hypothetical protein
VPAFDSRSTRTSTVIAVGLAATAALVVPTAAARLVALAGAAFVAVGAVFGSRQAASAGTVAIVAGVTLAGFGPSAPGRFVASTLFALLAWDAAQYGITMGEQLGRDAATARSELVHAAVSATVGTVGAAVATGTYLLVDAADSGLALVALLAGAVLLVSVMR